MLPLRSLRRVRLVTPALLSLPLPVVRQLHVTPPTLAARPLRPTTARKVILGMRGHRNKDLKSMKAKDRLSNELTHRGNVHPSLLATSRNGRPGGATADARVRFLPPTAAMRKPPAINRPSSKRAAPVVQPTNLVMGVSSAVHTPSQSPAAFRSGIKLSTPDKVEARKVFEFKTEPMRNLPPTASKFVSHPTLTGLPEHFTHPPLRPGLFSSVREYLESTRREGDRKLGQYVATPIQRLVLGHFFPPREAATGPTPVTGGSAAGSKLAEWQARKKDWLPRGMLPGSKTLFAAETGSGKTLAYILPVIQGLKDSEESRIAQEMAQKATRTAEQMSRNSKALPWEQLEDSSPTEESQDGAESSSIRLRPRALVLAPTHELARQIAGTFKALVHNEKLRVGCLSSGTASKYGNGSEGLPPDCDVLVGTMNRIRDLMGMSTLRDNQPDKKGQKREEAALARLIEREEEEARKWSDGPWMGEGLPPIDKRKRWMPDKRLTWAENLRARDAARLSDEDAGDEKPSWQSRSLRLMGETRDRKARKVLSLDRVEWLVLDEADVALNKDFVEDLLPVIEPLMKRVSPPPPRTIFATATVPETLTRFLQMRHPDTVRLITPNLHKLPHNLSVARVAWSGGNWRSDVLMEIRRAFVEDARDGNEHSQVLVFVNRTSRAEDLNEYLTEKGYGNLLMTSESKTRKRGSNRHVAGFLVNPKEQLQGLIEAKYDPKLHLPVKPPPKAIGNKIELDAPDPVILEQRVMVTTGVLSRGLDFSPNVSTVLMVDEPTTAVDFIHRAGRAGRAGNMGRVVIFSKSHKASMNALPDRRGSGGAGRGGAIWKTIQASRQRFESKRAKKSRDSTRGGKKGHGTFKRR